MPPGRRLEWEPDGYQGGTSLKRRLLELEGIPFSSSAVELKRAKLWVFPLADIKR
jgi:hypothetical protein